MKEKIAIDLVGTGKLSVEQMLDVGNKAEDDNVWRAVVGKLKTK